MRHEPVQQGTGQGMLAVMRWAILSFAVLCSGGCFTTFPEGTREPEPPRSADMAQLRDRIALDAGPEDAEVDEADFRARDRRIDEPDGPAEQGPDGAEPEPPEPDMAAQPDPDAGLEPDAPEPAPQGQQLVINEFDYDQPQMDHNEYVEIFNRGPGDVDLTDHALLLMDGAANPAEPFVVELFGVLRAGGYLVVGDVPDLAGDVRNIALNRPGNSKLQNGPDGLRLIGPNGIIDSVSYEARLPGVAEGPWDGPPLEDPGTSGSLSRCPNGQDTNDNLADFRLTRKTPGGPNPDDCDEPFEEEEEEE